MVIDTGFSTTSTNPVQNKVITAAMATFATKIDLERLTADVRDASDRVSSALSSITGDMSVNVDEIKSYVASRVAAADWMTPDSVYAFAQDEVGRFISRHDADSAAHPDIRELLDNTVSTVMFMEHYSDADLHVTKQQKDEWTIAFAELAAHLSEPYYTSAHVTAAEKLRWSQATQDVAAHVLNNIVHASEAEKSEWTKAADGLAAHVALVGDNPNPHVSVEDRSAWNIAVLDLNYHVSSPLMHLQAGERSSWTSAATGLAAHVADSVIHVTQTDRTNWSAAISALSSHIANKDPYGAGSPNPHHVTAADVGTMTRGEIVVLVEQAKEAAVTGAKDAVSAVISGGVKFHGSVDLQSELPTEGVTDGDAYIVNKYKSSTVQDVVTYQACVLVRKSGEWHPFSEPFTVDMSKFATADAVAETIGDKIDDHNESPRAHQDKFVALYNHISDVSNEVIEAADGVADGYVNESDFNAHVMNAENPHHTTARQAGALTADETRELVDSKMATATDQVISRLNSMISAGLHWKGTVKGPGDLAVMTHSTSSNPWVQGTPTTNTDFPAKGDCYGIEGTGQMFIYVGIRSADKGVLSSWPTNPNDPNFPEMIAWGWDDVGNIFDTDKVLQSVRALIESKVVEHNESEDSHPAIRDWMASFEKDYSAPEYDDDGVFTGNEETLHGVTEALDWCIGLCRLYPNSPQVTTLYSLVDGLFKLYSTRQPRLSAGPGVRIESVQDTAGNTLSEISWDPTAYLQTEVVTCYWKDDLSGTSPAETKAKLIDLAKNHNAYVRGGGMSGWDYLPFNRVVSNSAGDMYRYIGKRRDVSMASTDLEAWGWQPVIRLATDDVTLPPTVSYPDVGYEVNVVVVDRSKGFDFIDGRLHLTYDRDPNSNKLSLSKEYVTSEYVNEVVGGMATVSDVADAMADKQVKLYAGPGIKLKPYTYEGKPRTHISLSFGETVGGEQSVSVNQIVLADTNGSGNKYKIVVTEGQVRCERVDV